MFRRTPRYFLSCWACMLALVLVRSAHADFPWPPNGASVCNAPGDQAFVVHASGGAGGSGMGIAWIDRLANPDTLVAGGFTIQPPTGDCTPFSRRFASSGVRDVSVAFAVGPALGVPGPSYPIRCHVWLEGSGAAEQVVTHLPLAFPVDRIVVDDGPANRSHPRMTGSVLTGFGDTAMVVVWSDDRTGVPQIRAQRVSYQGQRTWGANGIVIAPTGTAQTEPDIFRLGDGSSLVVWTDMRAGFDIYALRLLVTGEVAPGWPATGLALEARSELASSPRITGDFFENLFVVWRESGARFSGGAQIVARKLVGTGTASNPGLGMPDPAWDPSGVALSTVATLDEFCDVRADQTGGLIAVWSDVRDASPSNPSDLYAQRITSTGAVAPGWPASGLGICMAPGRQGSAKLDVHVGGTSVYAWEDDRNGTGTDIYAAEREPDGSLPCCEWVANGLPATTAPGAQTGPAVEAGNSGGLLVAWTDARDLGTTGLDIYAQVFSFDGRNVDVRPNATAQLLLARPYPNPSRGRTRLGLDLPVAANVRLEVLDLAGRRVRTVASGSVESGHWTWDWDGRDDGGRNVRPGMYRVRASIGGVSQSRALVVMD